MSKESIWITICFVLTMVMLFVFPIVGLIMLLIFAIWMIVCGIKNLKHNGNCAMCHKKLTALNVGSGGKLKDDHQLCTKCLCDLSANIAVNCESYTLEELMEADKKAKAENFAAHETEEKQKNEQKALKNNKDMHLIVDSVLNPNEQIVHFVYGKYNKLSGYLVLTNDRLLFVYQQPIHEVASATFFAETRYSNASTFEEFPILGITDIKIEKNFVSDKIHLYLFGVICTIKVYKETAQAQQMVNLINERRKKNADSIHAKANDHGTTLSGTITWQRDDKEDALEKIAKLKELLDSGAITEEDFLEKKKKLLDMI